MSIGVGEGIELSATACTLLNNNKLGVSTYITTLKRTSLNSPYACIVYVRQANFTTKPRFKNLNLLICHFRVSPGLCIKTRLSAQPLIWKRFFILMQIKLIFTRKVAHLASFWKWGFLEFGSGLLIWKEFSYTKRANAKKVVHKRPLVVKFARLT